MQVVDVEVDRTTEVRITYDDDVTATFPVLALRLACPCAGCRGRRDQGRAAYDGDSISIVSAELHGNWGIAVRWSDGHDTGIFAWTHLRTWWDAGLDAGLDAGPASGRPGGPGAGPTGGCDGSADSIP